MVLLTCYGDIPEKGDKMSLRDMIDLVYIYDGLTDMERALSIMTNSDTAYMYDEGAMGKISRVMDILSRNTELYDPEKDEDVEGSEFARVLDNKELSPEERAKKLFNG